MQLYADFHTHTCYSHGEGTVLQNVQAAAAAGLTGVGITDHGPANLFRVGVENLGVFARIREEARQAERQVPGIKVLVGAEANIIGTDGTLDIPHALQQQLDIMLAGLHILVRPKSLGQAADIAGKNCLGRYWRRARLAALVANTDAVCAAVCHNRVDIVTHPGYRLPIDTKELARVCAATGTAMEVNTSHNHASVEYVRIVAAAGAPLVVSSDAHQPSRVGDLAAGLRLLELAGVDPAQVRNALPAR